MPPPQQPHQGPEEPDAAVATTTGLSADDVGGVHVKYLHHCHRQLWLYAHGYRPEAGSDLVAFGQAIDETSFARKRRIDLDTARIDWVDGRLWVHEVKSARKPDDAHLAQVRLYCLLLWERGVHVHGGKLHYPLSRQVVTVPFGPAERLAAEEDRRQVLTTVATPTIPPRLQRRRCRGCSYLDYCWS